ncbi:MAG: hypothetical protein D4Q77_00420 [Methanothrix sp.]|nr:MAG: hypothetical protein D4Q77_00420 [Methanothrix sp.]
MNITKRILGLLTLWLIFHILHPIAALYLFNTFLPGCHVAYTVLNVFTVVMIHMLLGSIYANIINPRVGKRLITLAKSTRK